MTKPARVPALAAALLLSGLGFPAAASGSDVLPCAAQVAPRVVAAGTVQQPFTLRVANGPGLPQPLFVQEVNHLRVRAPYHLQDVWPPTQIITPTAASAPPPWTVRILGEPTKVIFDDGRIPFGGATPFAIVGDVATQTGTYDWIVDASRDLGETLEMCQPAFSGALTVTVTP